MKEEEEVKGTEEVVGDELIRLASTEFSIEFNLAFRLLSIEAQKGEEDEEEEDEDEEGSSTLVTDKT